MRDVRAQTLIAVFAAGLLVGCVVAREKDPCAGDACDPIPLPARDIDRTETTETSSTKAAPLADAGSTTSGIEAGSTDSGPPSKGSGAPCDDRDECSSYEYCCFFPTSNAPKCALQKECGGPSLFVCEQDADCPSPLRCIAQTNTGHRACF